MKVHFKFHGFTVAQAAEAEVKIKLGLEIEKCGLQPDFERIPGVAGAKPYLAIEVLRDQDLDSVLGALQTGSVHVDVKIPGAELAFSFGDFVGNDWAKKLTAYRRHRRI